MQCSGAIGITLVLVLATVCRAYPYQDKPSQAATGINAALSQQSTQQQQQQQQPQHVNIRAQTAEQLAASTKAVLGKKIGAGLESTSSGRHIDDSLFKTIGKGHGVNLVVDQGPTVRPPVQQTIYYPYPVHDDRRFPYPIGYPYPPYPYPNFPPGPPRPPPFFPGPGFGPPFFGGFPPFGAFPPPPPPPPPPQFVGFGNFNGFNGFSGFADPGFIGNPGFNDFQPFVRSSIASDVIPTNPTDQELSPEYYTADAAAQQLKSLGYHQGRYATGNTGTESKTSTVTASSSGVPYYHFLQLGRV